MLTVRDEDVMGRKVERTVKRHHMGHLVVLRSSVQVTYELLIITIYCDFIPFYTDRMTAVLRGPSGV